MPRAKKQEQEQGQERTLEQVTEELDRLSEAEQRITARLREIEEQLSAGLTEEREARERALRSGYPAKPGGKSRELRLEAEDLQDQAQDVARMKARLELERLEFDKADADERYRQAMAEVAKIEPRFQQVEAELQQARNIASAVSNGRHSITERISRARQNLWNIDAEFRAAEEQAIEERRRQQEEGVRRQREAQMEAFDEAASEQRLPMIQVK